MPFVFFVPLQHPPPNSMTTALNPAQTWAPAPLGVQFLNDLAQKLQYFSFESALPRCTNLAPVFRMGYSKIHIRNRPTSARIDRSPATLHPGVEKQISGHIAEIQHQGRNCMRSRDKSALHGQAMHFSHIAAETNEVSTMCQLRFRYRGPMLPGTHGGALLQVHAPSWAAMKKSALSGYTARSRDNQDLQL